VFVGLQLWRWTMHGRNSNTINMSINHKTTYETPKMKVVYLRKFIDLLCDSGDPNCIILNYNEDLMNPSNQV
jgi:hypothetical protein